MVINGITQIKHLLLLGHWLFSYISFPCVLFHTKLMSYLTGKDEITVVCVLGTCSWLWPWSLTTKKKPRTNKCKPQISYKRRKHILRLFVFCVCIYIFGWKAHPHGEKVKLWLKQELGLDVVTNQLTLPPSSRCLHWLGTEWLCGRDMTAVREHIKEQNLGDFLLYFLNTRKGLKGETVLCRQISACTASSTHTSVILTQSCCTTINTTFDCFEVACSAMIAIYIYPEMFQAVHTEISH